MAEIVLSTAYLGPVEYYSEIVKADAVYVESCDFYQKQTYRNRCHIAAANGLMALTVPVEKTCSDKMVIRDVRISGHSDWQSQHWRSIESAYNSTPFFEYYKDELIPYYEKKWTYLFDLNQEIQNKILELLEIHAKIQLTGKYQGSLDEHMQDLREIIHPKKDHQRLKLQSYYQVFETRFGFLANLSIIDLLFNMGNESILILKHST